MFFKKWKYLNKFVGVFWEHLGIFLDALLIPCFGRLYQDKKWDVRFQERVGNMIDNRFT